MSTAANTGNTGASGSSAGAGSGTDSGKPRKAGLFDIRTFIAALLGFDGLVILLMGLFGDQATTVNEEPPININLWAGLGLIVAAVIFETWKRLRPVKVAESPPDPGDARPAH
jgi:hypothetical protein